MVARSEVTPTASLNIRQLDPALKEKLRIRAAHHGRSMEAEARAILKEVLTEKRPTTGADLAIASRRRFAPLGGSSWNCRRAKGGGTNGSASWYA